MEPTVRVGKVKLGVLNKKHKGSEPAAIDWQPPAVGSELSVWSCGLRVLAQAFLRWYVRAEYATSGK